MDRREAILGMLSVGLGVGLAQMRFVGLHGAEGDAAARGLPPDPGGDTDLCITDLQAVLSSLYPTQHFVEDDHYFGLMTELLHLGFRRVAAVRSFLERHRSLVLRIDAEAVALIRQGTAPEAWRNDYIVERAQTEGVFLSYVGLARTALIHHFENEYCRCDPSKW